MPRDLFSSHAKDYAAHRPGYPDALYRYIFDRCSRLDQAWDCATGNGQAAVVLAKKFRSVCATDISQAQLDHARKASNIRYAVCPAEKTPFEDHSFDLITVTQAFHWFDHTAFFQEASRVMKPDGVLAVWGYGLIAFEQPEMNYLMEWFYDDIVGPYWEPERKLIDQRYAPIHFPFKKDWSASFRLELRYTAGQLFQYLNTWSAVKLFEERTGKNPVERFKTAFLKIHKSGDAAFEASHDLFLKMGTL